MEGTCHRIFQEIKNTKKVVKNRKLLSKIMMNIQVRLLCISTNETRQARVFKGTEHAKTKLK